jgi:predicted ATPase
VITRFKAQGYRCLKDVEVRLTPLHAFIGPNDSGKTTLLRAVEASLTSAETPANPNRPSSFEIESSAGTFASTWEPALERFAYGGRTEEGPPNGSIRGRPQTRQFLSTFGKARWVRLDPDSLRVPGGLLPDDQPLQLHPRGVGLASVYDRILNRGDEAFIRISTDLRRLFPTVKRLGLRVLDTNKKKLEVELVDRTIVDAEAMSEGMLYFLGFAAQEWLDPVAVLLVEEPENGLHPSRVRDVMQVLRRISERGTQVLIATHSPLVVNELRPEEVSIVTRTNERGTLVTPIASTPNFADRSDVYALGELWLSYADGVAEAPLLQGGPRP